MPAKCKVWYVVLFIFFLSHMHIFCRIKVFYIRTSACSCMKQQLHWGNVWQYCSIIGPVLTMDSCEFHEIFVPHYIWVYPSTILIHI